MNAVVIACFSVMKKAAQAVDTLRKSCVADGQVRAILLKPPAAHPERAACGKLRRPGSIIPLVGHHAPAQAAMLESMGYAERRSPDRPAGVLLAVEAPDHVTRTLAVNVFSQHGARTIEAGAGASLDRNWSGSLEISVARLDGFGAEELRIPALCRPKPKICQN